MLKKVTKLLISTTNFIFCHMNVKENHKAANKILSKLRNKKNVCEFWLYWQYFLVATGSTNIESFLNIQ